MKLVVIVLMLVMTVFTVRAPEGFERLQEPELAKQAKLADQGERLEQNRLAAQNRLAEQERLAKQNQQLRKNPQLLHTIKKPVVAVRPKSPTQVVSVAGKATGEDLTEAQLKVIKAAENRQTFDSSPSHGQRKLSPPELSPTDMQKQIQRAESILVHIVELTNKLNSHESYDKALPLAERQLKAVEEFEDKMNLINADEVKESGLPEKIAAVKELLKDTITHKSDQLAEQRAAEVKAQELLAAQEKKTKQLILQVTTYLSDPGVQKILNPSVYNKVSPSESVLNLELLGLRDFTLEDALAQLPVDSKEREQLLNVQQFEAVAFKRLETEAPTFETVKNNILELIGSGEESGVFRKQAEEKIAFLKSKEIFTKLDLTSQEYVQEAIDQFNKSIDNVIKILTFPDTDNDNVASSLEKALQPKNPQAGLNYSYNQQNELYRLVRQIKESSEALGNVLTSISLPLVFERNTYIDRFKLFEVISNQKLLPENPSNENIASAIEKVLSPEFTLTFLDSKKADILGQKVAGRIGKEVLGISLLDSLTSDNRHVLSEVNGQQAKLAFEALRKELKIDIVTPPLEPENWCYIPHDFLEKIGEAWLRDFKNKNDSLSGAMKFKKEKILCNAWEIANGLIDSDRILIFRSIKAELFGYPLAKSLQLESLKSDAVIPELFTPLQSINAARLKGSFSAVKDVPVGLSTVDTINFIVRAYPKTN